MCDIFVMNEVNDKMQSRRHLFRGTAAMAAGAAVAGGPVPASGATLIIGAPKPAGGSGGSARILAMV